jgi:sugar phosphate isomerase/epimerase
MPQWDIGVITSLTADGSCLEPVAEFGLNTCQLSGWDPDVYDQVSAADLRAESESTGVKITSLWAGWPGPREWNFVDGPRTLGIVPREFRDARMAALKQGGDFAAELGVDAVVTHLGFVPENPTDDLFPEVVALVRELALYYQDRGLEFWFETGQETPTTMLRLIEEVGTDNLGINLDPANLLMYGKANPIDSLDVFGQYVRSVHAKDGHYPTDPMRLGREVKVGQGRVDFPKFLGRLGQIGYDGALIIEREISGEQQRLDIAETVEYLEGLMGSD